MSFRRFRLVFGSELAHEVARPLVWVLILILALTAWGLSKGDVTISSGNSAVGGTKAWITSEFNNAKLISMTVFLFYSLFLAVAAGMAIMQDEELKVGELLHATSLSPREYLWGKFLAVLVAFFGVLGLHLLLSIFFNHILPNPKAVEVRGPFAWVSYLRPALVFGLPTMIFMAGTSFAVGERSRKPILVFFLPVAALLFCAFFFWSWTPSWLDPRLNRLFMLLDPAGVRWLSETWLKVDRGVEFYNKARMSFDLPFLLSRWAFVLIGLGAVLLTERHFSAALRGEREGARREGMKRKGARRKAGARGVEGTGEASGASLPSATPARGADADLQPIELVEEQARPLEAIAMKATPPGILRGLGHVLRFEFQELRSQPGLYLFVPLILLQTLGTALSALGAFDTPILVTSGLIAVRSMNTLTLLICLLSLFYTVESLRRERNTGLFQIYFATPARTTSILFGKVLANGAVGVLVILATFVGGAIALIVQRKVGLDLGPFAVVWGLLLVPTLLLWTSFVMFLFAWTNNRYTTYALGLAALAATGLLQALGKMTWAGNWDLWSTLRWSDMGPFQLDRGALVLNRIAALGLTAFFVALTVRVFPRWDPDATRTVHRLSPRAILGQALRIAPYAVIPVVAVVLLSLQVIQGFQGKAEEKKHKDYWKQNLATWKDARLPGLTHVDIDLKLEPRRRAFRIQGSYALLNDAEAPLDQFSLTGGTHWEDVSWTLNGQEYKPENRSGLYVFSNPDRWAPGESLRIGFTYHGRFPRGITKNGGGTGEFILPSGVVLTSFSPSFVPVLGYLEDVGIDKNNRYEPRVYPDDFYVGKTHPMLGSDSPFTTRVRITGPSAYTLNSVGSKVSETVENGERTVVWESDHPVRFFNVVAGRWSEKRGEGTAVYYHPQHTYNIEEISAGLEAARRWYSEWFFPYPWRELKLSEFPALAFYAQGFPTNITFSEGIGFLTKSDPKTNTAFLVTAHEAAHQWWANLLTPGKGPGGDILSEGMAHFSTILLMEQEKGLRGRIEFCKRIEERYGDQRQVDSERPLVKIDGSRNGDETVTYDKGGWVFWMLLNRIGREETLRGLRSFIETYKDGPDYPVLQDFVEAMRPFAPDSASYGEFVRQWFFQVVVPEYRLSAATRIEAGESDGSRPGAVFNPESTATGNTPARADSAAWTVGVHVKNVGGGRMPVEVAAVTGDRFEKDGSALQSYRESRITTILGPGEERDVTIPCSFKPERVIVDPDAQVLQLMRKAALATLR